MHRLTTALLLGAGVLVTTWVSAPAAPTAPPTAVSAEDMAAIESTVPVAADLDQQVERLRAQLAVAPAKPEPARNPFAFGTRRPAPRVDPPTSAPANDTLQVANAAPEMLWPTLAAVMSEPAGLTGVIGWGDAIEFLKAGDRFKDFSVVSVTRDTIELRHDPTGVAKTIKLR